LLKFAAASGNVTPVLLFSSACLNTRPDYFSLISQHRVSIFWSRCSYIILQYYENLWLGGLLQWWL